MQISAELVGIIILIVVHITCFAYFLGGLKIEVKAIGARLDKLEAKAENINNRLENIDNRLIIIESKLISFGSKMSIFDNDLQCIGSNFIATGASPISNAQKLKINFFRGEL
ncbi:MAG: hypothetical protein LBT85_02300 [Bifidobacteriaceae bacterium]|jgi:hypothetical protein|nr:hypothetical protein [Bifidobacteriaceae bacterium]